MRKLLTAIFFLAGLCGPLSAQEADSVRRGHLIQMDGSFLEPLQPRDSVLIGDQLRYGVRMGQLPEGAQLALPDYSKGFREDVVVVRGWQLDTLRVKGREPQIEASIVITSFDDGLYELPPIAFLCARDAVVDTLVFSPQYLSVHTLPVDPETFDIHPIRPQIRYPLTFRETLPYLGLALLLLALGFGIRWLVRRLRKDVLAPEYKEPAHITALRKLDRYRGTKYWAPDQQKAFYSGVTDALREYIAARFEVGAMEMTTAEIFRDLRSADLPRDLYDSMKELFERSDFVKFAKMTASDEDNAKVLPAAVRFVTETFRAEVEEEIPSGEAPAAPASTPQPAREDDSAYMPKEG